MRWRDASGQFHTLRVIAAVEIRHCPHGLCCGDLAPRPIRRVARDHSDLLDAAVGCKLRESALHGLYPRVVCLQHAERLLWLDAEDLHTDHWDVRDHNIPSSVVMNVRHGDDMGNLFCGPVFNRSQCDVKIGKPYFR